MNRGRIFRRKKNNEKRFGKETFVFDLRFQHFADGNTTPKRKGGRGGRKGGVKEIEGVSLLKRRFSGEPPTRGDRGRQTTVRYGSREDRRQNVNRDTGANEPTRRRNVLSLANESPGVTAIHL